MKTTHDPAWTMPVPKAGRKYFNLGINGSYQAARTGEMPTVRIGRRVLACVPAIERMLGAQEEAQEALTPPRRPKAGGRPRIVEKNLRD